MIDFEAEVYTAVRTAVLTVSSSAYVTSEYLRKPTEFPCVILRESNNAMYRISQDSGSLENHALVTYEAQIFSNKVGEKKSEARNIAKTVDAAMGNLGFTRTMLNEIPNESDATICRYVGRYRAVIGADGKIYSS